MKTAVIVPNWNGERLLPVCLRALESQTVPPDEVLLVDNGSTDASVGAARAAFPGVRILELQRNFGFGFAVNRGIENCQADLILLLNNDTEARPDWVAAVRAFFERQPDAAFCACKMLNYFDRAIVDGAGDCLNRAGIPYKIGSARLDGPAYSQHRKVFGASGGACAFRRSFFDRVGMFDERFFMYLEDVDLSLRAQLAGIECHYLPDAVVYHMEASSDPERTDNAANPQTPARVYWIARNRVLLLAKNFPALLLLRYAPRILWGFARSFGFHLWRSGHVNHYVRGLSHGLALIPVVTGDRRAIRRSTVITLRRLQELLGRC